MPRLNPPKLYIELHPNEKATVTVRGTITFLPIDQSDMRNGSRTILRCALRGHDPASGDEALNVALQPPRHTYTGEQPVTVSYEFTARDVDKEQLNEDGLLDDEVYARARLQTDRGFDVSVNSNVIAGEFAERHVTAA